jgi:pyrroline-5-carboxylate reductase
MDPNQIIISIAAGIPLCTYRSLGDRQPLVRALPNPPSQIGQGIAPLVFSAAVSLDQRRLVLELFSALGEWVEVEEVYLNTITSLSSPVATYLFFQSLIEAGVACGLPLSMSTKIAAQTIIGSMVMWRSGELSPSDLIDQASTPGGVSVKSVEVLREHGFKVGVIDAIMAGTVRAEELGRKDCES